MGIMTGRIPAPAVLEGSRFEALFESSPGGTTDIADETQDPAAEAAARARFEAENAATDSAGSAAPPASTYEYGCDGSSMAGGGSVSSTDLLIWLEGHSTDLNGQLCDLMSNCEVRNKLVEDLTHLKAQITDSADGAPAEQARADAQALLEAYRGTPYEAELSATLDKIIDNPDDQFGKDEASTITGELQSAIDGYQKNDQIDMIYIQDLTSRIRESIQLVSNIVMSTNQTAMSIIGNVGR